MAETEAGPHLPSAGRAEELPGTLLHQLAGHQGSVLAVRFNSQGTYCLSCGKDRSVVLWNPHKGIRLKAYVGHGYDVRDASVSRDNSKFASCGGDRAVYLWDVTTGNTIRRYKGHEGVVNAVTHAAEDSVIVTAGYDQAVKIWDLRSRSIDAVQEIRHFKDSVMSVTCTDCAEIIAGSVDGTVRRFDVRMGRVYTDNVHQPVACVTTTRDGNCVLTACLDSRLRLLDKESGELLAQYDGHKHESIRADCAVMPDDATVLAGAEDGHVWYWDLVEDSSALKRFRAHKAPITSMSVHPDGRVLLTSSSSGEISVWVPDSHDVP